jgi:hypothetical protein
MVMSPIKLARECQKRNPPTMEEAVLFVSGDGNHVVTAIDSYLERNLIAMHAMRRAAMNPDLFPDQGVNRWQIADEDCRYVLGVVWDKTLPIACVIGCNPSSADNEKDDPTSKWWERWFRHFGYGGYIALNQYPFRTSSPDECRRIVRGIVDQNDYWARDRLHFDNLGEIRRHAKKSAAVFACWGNIAWDDEWTNEIVEEIQTGEAPYPDIMCWGTTKSGAPIHPMARGKHRIDPLRPAILWRAATPLHQPRGAAADVAAPERN